MNAMKRIDAHDVQPVVKTACANTESGAPKMPPIIDSSALFAGGAEILIAHAGSHYRLTITRQGKLILTK